MQSPESTLIDGGLMLCRKAKIHILIQAMTFDFDAWTAALSTNRTLEDVTISVQLPSLGSNNTSIATFFKAIGSLPRLKSFHLRPGKYTSMPTVSFTLLLSVLNERAVQLTTFHIQDMEFRDVRKEGILKVADEILPALPELKVFTIAHCRFANTLTDNDIFDRVRDTSGGAVLDPLVAALLKSSTVEKIVISAARMKQLGGCPLAMDTLRNIFVLRQQVPLNNLKELRLLKFDFPSTVLRAFFGTLLVHFPSLETLLVSSCQWDSGSVKVLSQLLHSDNHLCELHLLGPCDYFRTNEEPHVEIADALHHGKTIRRFFLEPLHRRIRHDDEDEISKSSQKNHVKRMETNYSLEECRIVSLFAPEQQALMEFYMRLNIAGRRNVFLPEGTEGDNRQDSSSRQYVTRVHQRDDDKVAWLNVITAANDSVSCIFYFLVRNPSLCAATPK